MYYKTEWAVCCLRQHNKIYFIVVFLRRVWDHFCNLFHTTAVRLFFLTFENFPFLSIFFFYLTTLTEKETGSDRAILFYGSDRAIRDRMCCMQSTEVLLKLPGLRLTLWHRHWETLRARLLCSHWRLGHWDSNPSNVRVVPVGAIVGTPVVIPGAANRLRTHTNGTFNTFGQCSRSTPV